MSKENPMVQKFMTTLPVSIEETSTIAQAQSKMSELEIRHLPVTRDGEITGVLSDHDIKTACSLKDVDVSQMHVSDIYHQNPYIVEPDAHLSDVAKEMAAHHYGCAIIIQNKKLVGIFTAVDACHAISVILEQRQHI